MELNEIVEKCLSTEVEGIKWTIDNVKAFRETSKLLYSIDRTDDALKMCSATALGISKSIMNNRGESSSELRELGTKVLLTLGKSFISIFSFLFLF